MNLADEKVARFILREFRDNAESDLERHLASCPEVTVTHVEGENGTYGCDTGCDYARMTADIQCPHMPAVEFEYGDFGEIAFILEDIESADV
jgi:hypothetical protein